MHPETIEAALDACYEAVTEPEGWTPAMNRLAAATGSAAAMFYPKDVGAAANRQIASCDYAGLLEDYVAGGWYENHYRADRGWPLLEKNPSVVVLEQDLATDEERRRLAHYNELYLRWGMPGFAAIGFRVEGSAWCLPLLRSHSQGFFSREEAARLIHLSPHLRRMMHLSEQFAVVRGTSGVEVLDRLGRAAALIDWKGRVTHLNSRAEQLTAASGGALVLKEGRLGASHAGSNARLQRLLSTAGALDHRQQRQAEVLPVPVERAVGRPLILELVSLRDLVRPMSPRASAILLISDPDAVIPPDQRALCEVLGLTLAEARFAAILATGESLDSTAEACGISEGTARTRLKQIFAKTDTHRQGELVTLLSRLNR